MKLFALASASVLLCLAGTATNINPAMAIGSPSAPITIEVYSSFDCPHCKDFEEDIVPLLKRDFINRGKLYLVNRSFPLLGHPYAREAADYAAAAARIGKYRQVANAIWAKQDEWALNGQVWPVVASVLTLPEQNKVQALAKSPDVRDEVQRDLDKGLAAGINQTPTLIIIRNGQRTPIVGAPRYDLLKGYLDSLLAR